MNVVVYQWNNLNKVEKCIYKKNKQKTCAVYKISKQVHVYKIND